MGAVLFVGSVGRKLVQYTAAGTAGALIVKGASALAPRLAPAARRVAVAATAQGILASRKLGEMAEEAMLRANDIAAEARSSLGEEAPPPSASAAADTGHGHAH